ncbi:hypothetical protein, partial [Kitasatospora sp. NPDC059571]|uniref:hypothetical protein n=1 Tax=Kitasatospora sp. NPDC059571 TaxID=3346871 RepID=UPI0036C36F0B
MPDDRGTGSLLLVAPHRRLVSKAVRTGFRVASGADSPAPAGGAPPRRGAPAAGGGPGGGAAGAGGGGGG